MKKPFKTYVYGSDIHVPDEDKDALDCFLQAIDLIKPDGVIINGDIMDCHSFSRHDIFSPPKCHWKDEQFYEDSEIDYEVMNLLLDKLSPYPVDYMLGNHEMWLLDFIKNSPKTRVKLFGLEERLKLSERNIKVYPYRKIIRYGKLAVTHTLFDRGLGAKFECAKNVDAMGSSILTGHKHTVQSFSKVTPEGQCHMGFVSGCLSNKNPDYNRNAPTANSHEFKILYVMPNGYFQLDSKLIVAGKTIVNNKLINGKERRIWK